MKLSFPGPLARGAALGASMAGVCACLSIPLAAAASSDADRGQPAAQAQTVVIAATRRPLPQASALADISVISRDAIERSGATCAADLLATLPGVDFTRNGGPAGTTSVHIRGAEARHTAVYIDGVRVDSQATGGAQWELLPIDQIERIEVLRGAAAAVYGSDAVGGVVQMFTRRGQDGRRASASVAVGSHDTVQLRAGFGQRVGDVDYTLSAAHARSKGWDAQSSATSNPDNDGWRRSSLQGSVGWRLSADHRVEAALLASNLWNRFDGFSAADDDQAWQTLRSGSVNWQGRWGAYTDTRVQVGQSTSTYENQPSFYRTETRLRNLLIQGGHRWGRHLFTGLIERKEDRLHNPATTWVPVLNGDRHQDALAIGWQADYGAHSLQAHVRHDQDSDFGAKPTASLGWGWRMSETLRASATAATTFRAPTLYQRFSEYGQANLQPESGKNVEVALRWSEGDSEASVTAWRNRVSDLIIYGATGPCASAWGCYENAERARLEGVTLAGETRALGSAWSASVDWQDPRNLVSDTLLPRRARVVGRLAMNTAVGQWGLGAQVRASGARYDDSANTRRLGGYALIGLHAERALGAGWSVLARVDSVADKDYEVAQGYPTGGRQWTLALRWSGE